MKLSLVPPDQIWTVWPQVRPMVLSGLRHGAGDSTSEREILAGIASGRTELWAVHDGPEVMAIVIVQVVQRERGRALFVVLVAGREFRIWCGLVQRALLDYAELIGAYTIEAVAREGMARWLTELGWKRKAVTMALEVRHGK